MTQLAMFGRARCGYCDRELVARGPSFECPRCAPLLRILGAGLPFDEQVEAFRWFQVEAARS